MPDVLILQHADAEGPAAIAEVLHAAGCGTRVVRAHAGEPVPARLESDAGLVVMGGPMGVYETERHPHLRDELRLIEHTARQGRPVLGICLGSQLLAAALGARVYPGGYREIGWLPVELGEAAAADALFGGAPRRFTALIWHGDVFDLPAGAVPLASSALTEHQGFRHGDNAYGLLFHLEATRPQLEAMVGAFADEIAAANVTPADLLADADARIAAARVVGDPVFGRFAALVTTTSC
jgi:GMP synthase (glutamine-hydrolysing)